MGAILHGFGQKPIVIVGNAKQLSNLTGSLTPGRMSMGRKIETPAQERRFRHLCSEMSANAWVCQICALQSLT
jgi:hypothetical protein